MVPLLSLALPILVASVVVFIASSIIHMVLPYHRSDIKRLDREDEFLETVRRLNVPPGDYAAPHAGSMAGMKDPKFIERMKRGPLVILTVARGSEPNMGPQLALWFLYSVVVSLFAGYVASRAVGPGVEYLEVFRFVGTTAFMGYSLGVLQHSIWYRRQWTTTFKVVVDGFIYALLTAGVFGWLWPRP